MKRCRLKRLNFQIRNKMNKKKQTLDKPQNGNDFIADVSSSATRTIRMQQGLTQFEYTLPEDDAVMFMLILKRNKIWFADVTR